MPPHRKNRSTCIHIYMKLFAANKCCKDIKITTWQYIMIWTTKKEPSMEIRTATHSSFPKRLTDWWIGRHVNMPGWGGGVKKWYKSAVTCKTNLAIDFYKLNQLLKWVPAIMYNGIYKNTCQSWLMMYIK